MNLYLDMDGPLVDFVLGFCKFTGMSNPYPERNGDYYFTPKDWWKEERFNVDFWAELPRTRFADKLIAECCRLADCYILTTPTDLRSRVGKMRWFRKHYPLFPQERIIFSSDKGQYADGKSLLIDDWDLNVEKFGEHGILLPGPMNKMHSYKGDSATYVLREAKRILKAVA